MGYYNVLTSDAVPHKKVSAAVFVDLINTYSRVNRLLRFWTEPQVVNR